MQHDLFVMRYNIILLSHWKSCLFSIREKCAQIKHHLQEKQFKTVRKNMYLINIWCERTRRDGFFSLEEASLWITDFWKVDSWKLKRFTDGFVFTNIQRFDSQDIHWWTGVVSVTCEYVLISDGTHSLQGIHLVSKWCNAKFVQICSNEETNYSTSQMAWGWVNHMNYWLNHSFKPDPPAGHTCNQSMLFSVTL